MRKLLILLLLMMFLVPAAHAEEPILRHLTTPDGLTLAWYDGPSSAISTMRPSSAVQAISRAT